MAIKKRRPRNASLRFQSYVDSRDITKKKPEKSLVKGIKRINGRNAYGRITVRHRGGGAKRLYRDIDIKRMVRDVPGVVTSVEYDPNRSARIGLVVYSNGVKHYMLLPQGIAVGSKVMSGLEVEARIGNALPLRNIPLGFFVHNIENKPGAGGVYARSAGSSAQCVAKLDDFAVLKMPSGEVRKVPLDCWATVGILSNPDHKNISLGSAGRNRHRGKRPSVRGMAMNPVDHPMGGGEGRSKGHLPVSPWGKGAKGDKTRKKKNTMVVQERKSKKKK
ncbi:MAG: 50S ribosomal protein L2 [Candidatus Babeliales bacterium]